MVGGPSPHPTSPTPLPSPAWVGVLWDPPREEGEDDKISLKKEWSLACTLRSGEDCNSDRGLLERLVYSSKLPVETVLGFISSVTRRAERLQIPGLDFWEPLSQLYLLQRTERSLCCGLWLKLEPKGKSCHSSRCLDWGWGGGSLQD